MPTTSGAVSQPGRSREKAGAATLVTAIPLSSA